MHRNRLLIGSGVLGLLLVGIVAYAVAQSASELQLQRFKESAKAYDCTANSQDPESAILHIVVDDKEFCSLSNFLFYGEESEEAIANAANMPVTAYQEAISHLLDLDDVPEKDRRYEELLGLVIAFYRSPYQQLTVVVKNRDSTLERTLRK